MKKTRSDGLVRMQSVATRALLAGVAIASMQCTVPFADFGKVDAPTGFGCAKDEDCPDGSVCSEVTTAPLCVNQSANLPLPILQIRTKAASAQDASQSYMTDLDAQGIVFGGVRKDGQASYVETSLSGNPIVRGRILDPACGATGDHSVPARLEWVGQAPDPKLPVPRFTAEATFDGFANQYSYEVKLPTGSYDVFVEPLPWMAVKTCQFVWKAKC